MRTPPGTLERLTLCTVLLLIGVTYLRRHRGAVLVATTRLCQAGAHSLGRAAIACEDKLREGVTA